MKKNSLSDKGLSLSQAQSISNLCNQRAREIGAILNGINNCSKSVKINLGNGNIEEHQTIVGKKIPTNVVALLTEKSILHACQAFLMENIKAKDSMLREIKSAVAEVSTIKVPEQPIKVYPATSSPVDESWGWEQLTVSENNEFIEAEAYAAHIGQFIHEDSVLDRLRKELPTIPPTEWMTIQDGIKSPVVIKVHHNAEDLLAIHEELAGIHRSFEQRVNYFKAKVKNLVTEENARIAKNNADAQNKSAKINNDNNAAYETQYKKYQETVKSMHDDFEKERQEKIKEIAAMRINIDPRFQKTIDLFLSKISLVQE